MEKIVRKITEKDRQVLSEIIKDVVTEQKKDKNVKAVFVNCFRKNEIDNIHINIIKKDDTSCSRVIWASLNNDLVIERQCIPEMNFLLGEDLGLIKALSEGILLYDKDGGYNNLQKDAAEYDFDDYNLGETTLVEFEPPLNIKKTKKRRR